MLAKLHSLSQQVRWFPRALMIFFLFLEAGNVVAFENSIAKKTSGESYPHILQKETFTINTRNIKVLNASDKYLWIGTSKGLLRYDTNGNEEVQVYDNTNKLLSNGIFAIAIDKNGFPWVGTYGGGLSHFNGKSWKNFNTPDGLNDAFIYDIKIEKKSIWLATWSGVNFSRWNDSNKNSW